VPKYRRDMEAIRAAAVSGEECFFNGSDSAPHHWRAKEAIKGCAGIFNSPTQYQTLAEVFEQDRAVQNYEPFTSTNGLTRYGLPLVEDTVTLVKHDWQVPMRYSLVDAQVERFGRSIRRQSIAVVPFRAGQTITWQFQDRVN